MRGFQKNGPEQKVAGATEEGLERLCGTTGQDEIRAAPVEAGVERIEARFHGNGFEPHRHDTYAIGLTVSGVQTFRYRGVARYSMPGQIIVLHPDELHDGGAGTDAGLRYRMVYVPPECVVEASGLPGKGLPFVSVPVVDDAWFRQSLTDVLQGLDQEIGSLKLDGFLADLAAALNRHSDNCKGIGGAIDWQRLNNCRDYLRHNFHRTIRSCELEELAGMSRFALARQFRLAFGTSPHRYQVLRRLDRVRAVIGKGGDLAQAAAESGFADQSHMSRHFKLAYGMTPGHWRALCAPPDFS